ncbi:PTS fructose transporter subunit IIBC [Serratia microhaemolytica]|uniref:PTS fructose transporter subunit IIBC n=1 Tax=Serratia microhaemolytica TaxID=2675110 RepID=UPI000FDF0D55|nr:PTS fructose transporter subunit IIBC [Serratia microhaemolytica]
MKAMLLVDSSRGQACSHLIKHMLAFAVRKTDLKLVDSLSDAQLVVVAADHLAADASLNGKLLYRGDIATALRDPNAFLHSALVDAKPYTFEPDRTAEQQPKRIIAVTACPTGVAHTFMAAEAIEREATSRGWWVKVETRGAIGTENSVTSEEIMAADFVLVAADIDIDLEKFAHKPIYRTTTRLALMRTAQELDNAQHQAEYQTEQPVTDAVDKQRKTGNYRHLLTGVSYMLPMVVAGGLSIALSYIFGITAYEQPDSFAAALMQIGGGSAFMLMVPVLAGYIAFSIADRPGLTPGLIGGMLAVNIEAGFLGGIVAGFLAGYLAKMINTRLRLPATMEALKPILIVPLVASLVTGLVMIYLLGTPIASLMVGLTEWLQSLGRSNAILLGAILGGMMCTDMGGPVNKVAYASGVALLSAAVYAPMAAIMAAGMVPPLAMGLATLLAPKKFEKSEKEAGKAAIVLGLCFISEGAIPFAARDPMRVLPCCIVGGAVSGALSMAFGAKLMAPHGGLFVLLIPGAISSMLWYLLAIIIGTLLAGVSYSVLKRSCAL